MDGLGDSFSFEVFVRFRSRWVGGIKGKRREIGKYGSSVRGRKGIWSYKILEVEFFWLWIDLGIGS